MKTVLTIAGFDPSSGAGVTADLMVFAAHGLFGTACITALTVQSTLGVLSTHPVSNEILSSTLDCLNADLPPSGIKIGMLSCRINAIKVDSYIRRLRLQHSGVGRGFEIPVVLDPVLRSSSGRELLDPAGIEVLQDSLLSIVDWVTPNLDELGVLTGRPVDSRGDVPAACAALQDRVAEKSGGHHRLGIFATGGHLDPPDDSLMMPGGEGIWLPGERVVTQSTHGTGCALSSAFLSRLVLGDASQEAAKAAKRYVSEALRTAVQHGLGRGPMNHLWLLSNEKDQVSMAR